MSWKKHFTPVQTGNNPEGSYSPFTRAGSGSNPGPARTNYSSYLPDVYVGSPNRVERYGQYNTMDMDSEVNAALDILAEFTTQQNTQNKTPFLIDFKTKATNTEVTPSNAGTDPFTPVTIPGLVPQVTCGSMFSTSITSTLSNFASSSVKRVFQ